MTRPKLPVTPQTAAEQARVEEARERGKLVTAAVMDYPTAWADIRAEHGRRDSRADAVSVGLLGEAQEARAADAATIKQAKSALITLAGELGKADATILRLRDQLWATEAVLRLCQDVLADGPHKLLQEVILAARASIDALLTATAPAETRP